MGGSKNYQRTEVRTNEKCGMTQPGIELGSSAKEHSYKEPLEADAHQMLLGFILLPLVLL
jgi:hypothetical protein